MPRRQVSPCDGSALDMIEQDQLRLSFPSPKPEQASLVWDGNQFVSEGGQVSSVLEYSENFVGWSDDLTLMHEEAVGDNHPIDIASRNNALESIRELNLKPRSRVLEIGCSSGFLLRGLVSEFKEFIIVGADVVKEPLYKLAAEGMGVPLLRFDLLKCPLPEASFDVVVMLNVLEHIGPDTEALEKLWRLLKPGGFLILEVPAGEDLYDPYDSQLCHFRRYSIRGLSTKLQRAGFEIKRKSHLGFFIFPLFALVKLKNRFFGVRQQDKVVEEQAQRTSGSKLLRWSLELETKMRRFNLPFGIRALIVARRP